ncbi:MAG: MFS transporter [Actinomycetota bacterium]|nr:MFS transporter [Actinomycetota bacterium]
MPESADEPDVSEFEVSAQAPRADDRWFSAGVAGIGGASFLADLGHEIPTALLPSLLVGTLHAPASALGLVEGISDAAAGITRLGGGALADDPARRRSIAVGGYATTAVLSAGLGAAGAPWQAGLLRAGAWGARGLRVPARNALLADIVPPGVYGRAYGFERAMDNLGAIGGPLLAIGLVALSVSALRCICRSSPACSLPWPSSTPYATRPPRTSVTASRSGSGYDRSSAADWGGSWSA